LHPEPKEKEIEEVQGKERSEKKQPESVIFFLGSGA